MKADVTRFKKAFLDAQVKIVFQIAEGDKFTSRYSWSGTHQGEFVGIPATGKQEHWTAKITFRVVDGKIRQAWYNMDRL